MTANRAFHFIIVTETLGKYITDTHCLETMDMEHMEYIQKSVTIRKR